MNSRSTLRVLFAALLSFVAGGWGAAHATPPPEGCSLLTPAQIQKVLGQPFGAPSESKAPPAYGNQPWGANCQYSSQKGPHVSVVFIVYVEASASEAKQTFDKLSGWFAPKSKPAIGDAAYIDSRGAIHVLKGKIRYYISVDTADEKQLKDLAASVAAGI